MSDININKRNLEFILQIERPSLEYVSRVFSRTVLFSEKIPYPKFLCELTEGSINVPSLTTSSAYMYTDLFEKAIPADVFALRDSADV